jgi:hypothetical protein
VSFYFTDKVSFISITENQSTGEKTKATAVTVKCRVENTNKTFKNADGSIIQANSLIMWPKNVIIKKGDSIQITEIMGVSKSNEVAYDVVQVMPAGAFVTSHIEVYI